MTPLPPGATLGILGGGQLGRLLALDAARLGFDVHVLCPEPDCPAGRVAARHWVHAYDDEAALCRFADAVDAVTYEFENVPVEAVAVHEGAGATVRPGAAALRTAQDRLVEKRFFRGLGAATVPFEPVDDRDQLDEALARVGGRGILKRRRCGYDGKGQARIRSAADLDAAWEAVGGVPLILEGFADFALEVSVVAARDASGAFVAYDLPANRHRDGILWESTVPAPVEPEVAARAVEVARTAAEALDYVGVLAIEYFVMPDGEVLVNETAPRVHNSGHWTPEACITGQFEQHVRAVVGWPLGSVRRVYHARMRNLLGDEVGQWEALARAGEHVTLYGKRQVRPGRKMGHTVALAPRTGRR